MAGFVKRKIGIYTIELLSRFCRYYLFLYIRLKGIVMSVLNYPLSNVQMELLKLFSTNLSDSELIELKDTLARFYADKAIARADAIWDERGLTDLDMEKWLNEKS